MIHGHLPREDSVVIITLHKKLEPSLWQFIRVHLPLLTLSRSPKVSLCLNIFSLPLFFSLKLAAFHSSVPYGWGPTQIYSCYSGIKLQYIKSKYD